MLTGTSKIRCSAEGCNNDTFRIEYRRRLEGLVRSMVAICTECGKEDIIPSVGG